MNLDHLREALAETPESELASATLTRLTERGFDVLPPPGSGSTLRRWQALATVAEHDLSLAKLYEGHTDALAIWQECTGSRPASPGTWGVWAAEAPPDRLLIEPGPTDGEAVVLQGLKHWCSGAASATHALVTAWVPGQTKPQLVALDLAQDAVQVESSAWRAIGMSGSPALDVRMTRARGRLVGEPGEYLDRPGFWHGGAGVAACWFGGTIAIADALRGAVQRSSRAPDALRLAALGRVDLLLHQTAAVLREVAHEIDAAPARDAQAACLRARLAAEACASATLDEVGRALGAAPFCRDAKFARMAVDLPVFIRQSHADRDLANLGTAVLEEGGPRWAL